MMFGLQKGWIAIRDTLWNRMSLSVTLSEETLAATKERREQVEYTEVERTAGIPLDEVQPIRIRTQQYERLYYLFQKSARF